MIAASSKAPESHPQSIVLEPMDAYGTGRGHCRADLDGALADV